METVTLKALIHHSMECIGIYFKNSAILNSVMNNAADARWSKTFRCWYVTLSEENHDKLVSVLAGKVMLDEFLFPFEITSILLLAAMVGAVMLGKKEENV